MCTNPRIVKIKNIKGTPFIKRNVYNVPCGKCEECKNRKRRDYELRGIKEYQKQNTMIFITLTYNEENLPRTKLLGIPQFSKDDITKYIKRLRENIYNHIAKKEKRDKTEIRKSEVIKYLVTSEYGEERKRPHYHAIISIPNKSYYMELINIIQKTWTKGFTMLGNNFGIVNSINGIKYVTKYITKSSGEEQYEKEIEKKYQEAIKNYTEKGRKILQAEWENYQHKFFHISNEFGEYKPKTNEWKENKIYIAEKEYTIPNYYKYKNLYDNVKTDEGKWQRQINNKGINIFSENYNNIIKQSMPLLSQTSRYKELTDEEKEFVIVGRFHKITKEEKDIKRKWTLFAQEENTTTIKDIEIFDKLINSRENNINNESIEAYEKYIYIRNNYLRTFKNDKIKQTIKEYDILKHDADKEQKKENRKTERAEVMQKKLWEKWNKTFL